MLERRSGAERVSDEERVLDHSPASGEVALLIGVQRALARPVVVKAARGLSHFGEHSAGWFALGLVGAAFDSARRKEWLTAAMGAVGAHAASIAVKRVVRRRRPEHPDITIGVGTPSRLSFPSSHATSTTAAAVLYSGLIGRNLVPALVPPMLVSRLVLGVHYPTDVLAGAALGGAVGGILRRRLTSRKRTRR
ncbi:phosphatase PAP2 family protein [Saccharomonospora viridis]|jgi:membrane-associated phospholipid phosphatase|uniref:Membrane-associated phospholipid phosphatase n=2 Tax=Saccharomonospora viridis TaxID=1852 RepID=C7MSA7_SACVD|nr:phosphatase PAP2 family protein [Saccharomonospora viridis]ACU95220.1 membrane-associated phospholipid phosphatase [Saccharomonospora viridis DSM 43017]KHF44854.1 phospholipid phosphatase [Saccharomonospora viridis]SFP19304.1 5'-phosphoribosyl-monophospho-decaprenol phosphatase [Saccharomonospora viridis]